MARRVAELQYKPQGYLERLGQTAGEGLDVGRVIGRAGVPGDDPGVILHPRNKSLESVAAGEQDKRKTSYTPSLGAAEARAKLRGQKGGFSPSRQLPPTDMSRSFVAQTESPAILRLWDERKRSEMGMDYAEALASQQESKAILMAEQAEEAALDPLERVRREFEKMALMHKLVKDKLAPNVEQKVKKDMAMAMTQPEMIKQLANNKEAKQAYEAILRARHEKEAFAELVAIYSQMTLLSDPNQAALARYLQAQMQYGYGGAGMPMAGAGIPPGTTGTR
jgi:hypothetical protein